jgi:hypothetical protein
MGLAQLVLPLELKVCVKMCREKKVQKYLKKPLTPSVQFARVTPHTETN